MCLRTTSPDHYETWNYYRTTSDAYVPRTTESHGADSRRGCKIPTVLRHVLQVFIPVCAGHWAAERDGIRPATAAHRCGSLGHGTPPSSHGLGSRSGNYQHLITASCWLLLAHKCMSQYWTSNGLCRHNLYLKDSSEADMLAQTL